MGIFYPTSQDINVQDAAAAVLAQIGKTKLVYKKNLLEIYFFCLFSFSSEKKCIWKRGGGRKGHICILGLPPLRKKNKDDVKGEQKRREKNVIIQ